MDIDLNRIVATLLGISLLLLAAPPAAASSLRSNVQTLAERDEDEAWVNLYVTRRVESYNFLSSLEAEIGNSEFKLEIVPNDPGDPVQYAAATAIRSALARIIANVELNLSGQRTRCVREDGFCYYIEISSDSETTTLTASVPTYDRRATGVACQKEYDRVECSETSSSLQRGSDRRVSATGNFYDLIAKWTAAYRVMVTEPDNRTPYVDEGREVMVEDWLSISFQDSECRNMPAAFETFAFHAYESLAQFRPEDFELSSSSELMRCK